jgi:hypothetical protein
MRDIIQVAISTWMSACNSSTMVPTGSRNGRCLGWKIFGMIQFARNPSPTKMPTKMRRRQPARKPRELKKILLISPRLRLLGPRFETVTCRSIGRSGLTGILIRKLIVGEIRWDEKVDPRSRMALS